MGQVIQPADQAKRVAKHRKSRLPKAGCYTEPGLLSKLDHDSIRYRLDGDREGGLAAGARPGLRPDLDSHFITFAHNLRAHAALVEFGHQSLCNVGRG